MRLLVNIDVPDLEWGIAFYTAALPLVYVRRLFEGTVAELSGGSSPVYLLQAAEDTAATPTGATRRYARHWTPVHLDFQVEDIEAAVLRAQGAGATLEGGIDRYAWGRLARFSDPFGHGFCLVQFSGDAYAGAENGRAPRT